MPAGVRGDYLGNGLKVILKEVHTAPIISTWIWYRVGSRHEVEGYTGLSHWVEHMMFKGSSQFPKGSIMRAVDRYGGYVNAMTSQDFTAYYETLPSDRAELALQIEADRMLTARFDLDEVEAERTVIIAEREGAENEPSYVLAEEVAAAAFRVHPYHHQTIGWTTDLLSITRDQLYRHYQRCYIPNNAVLVIVGDFDTESYLTLIERYLGSLPAGEPMAETVRQEPPQRGERRVVLRMPGSAPLVRISYHTPQVSHPDYIPLVVLDAILSGGRAMFAFGDSPTRSARLYRALVETQLAVSAGSNCHPSRDPFLFSLGATAREGREPRVLEEALLAEIAKLREEPIQQRELEVAIRQTQAQFAYASESVTNQALTLGFLEMMDNHERMDGLLAELARVTPEDLLRVARTYFAEEDRVVGWFVPTTEGGGEGDGRRDPAAQIAPKASPWRMPGQEVCAYSGARNRAISPETVTRQKLDNGIVVLIKENPVSPSVAVEGEIRAGSLYESDADVGLASFTASMLRRGTRQHSFQEINAALDNVGASLSYSAGQEDVGFGGRALIGDFDLLIELLAEILMQPTFPEIELEKLRGQTLTHLNILDTDTGYRADRAFMTALYPPGHPYARPVMGYRDTVRAFGPQHLADYHRTHYHPETIMLSVVGAVEPRRVLDRISATLGRWHVEGEVPVRSAPPAATPEGISTRREQIPGKAQADMIWGVIGMPRTSPDYYPAMVANIILGRLGLMGRLGQSVRDTQGLAYYVSSSLHAGPGPYPWNIVAGVQPRNTDRALASILNEVQRLRDEPVQDVELADSRSYLTGALPLHLETNEGIASFLLNTEKYGLGLDYLQRYPTIIGGVTQEDIQRTVRRYLTLDRYVLAMAGTFDAPLTGP